MKFIDLVSNIRIVSLNTPFSNLLFEEYLNEKDDENIKELIVFFINL